MSRRQPPVGAATKVPYAFCPLVGLHPPRPLVMHEHATPVATSVGTLYGRDTLFLEAIDFDYGRRRLTLQCVVSSNGCSNAPQGRDHACRITLDSVYCMKMTELDTWNGPRNSCLLLVRESAWIAKLNAIAGQSRIDPTGFRHYIVQTYDHVFDVVAQGLEFEVLPVIDGK